MVRQLERGYVPAASIVLPRVIQALNDENPVGEPGSRETSGVGAAGHETTG